jgi:hypothetical protein
MTTKPTLEKIENDRAPLVGPMKYDDELEREYWTEYDALVRRYREHRFSDISEEGMFGLHCLGTWPLAHAEWDDNWPSDWHFRFDAQTLELLQGDDLLLQHIPEGGLMEGYDEKSIADEIETFIAWLGEIALLPKTLAERLSNEFAQAKPTFLKMFAETDTNYQIEEDYEAEAGHFVYWLRTEKRWPLDKLLLGQSLCIDALKSLESLSIDTVPWQNLDIVSCIRYTARQLPCLDLTQRDLRDTAVEFIGWLSSQGLLDRFDRRRLIRKVSHASFSMN